MLKVSLNLSTILSHLLTPGWTWWLLQRPRRFVGNLILTLLSATCLGVSPSPSPFHHFFSLPPSCISLRSMYAFFLLFFFFFYFLCSHSHSFVARACYAETCPSHSAKGFKNDHAGRNEPRGRDLKLREKEREDRFRDRKCLWPHFLFLYDDHLIYLVVYISLVEIASLWVRVDKILCSLWNSRKISFFSVLVIFKCTKDGNLTGGKLQRPKYWTEIWLPILVQCRNRRQNCELY